MTKPTFTAPPVAPVRASPTFETDVGAFLVWMRNYQPELSTAIDWMEDQLTTAEQATVKAGEAAASATAAADSATTAEGARDAAQTAQTGAQTAATQFQTVWCGAGSTAPVTNGLGGPLTVGCLWFDTAAGAMKTYSGTSFVAGVMDANGALVAANNLAELTDKAAARENLDLEPKAVTLTGTAVTADMSAGSMFTLETSGATTIDITNPPPAGTLGRLSIKARLMDSAHSLSFTPTIRWTKDGMPSLPSPGGELLIDLITIDGGLTYLEAGAGEFNDNAFTASALTPGVHSFTIPQDVTTVSLGAVGAGGAGGGGTIIDGGGNGGEGGDTVYANDIPVAPGDVLTIVVGAGAASSAVNAAGTNGGDTIVSLNGVEIVRAAGGYGGGVFPATPGASPDRSSLSGVAAGVASKAIHRGGKGGAGSDGGGAGGAAGGLNGMGGNGRGANSGGLYTSNAPAVPGDPIGGTASNSAGAQGGQGVQLGSIGGEQTAAPTTPTGGPGGFPGGAGGGGKDESSLGTGGPGAHGAVLMFFNGAGSFPNNMVI